MELLLTLLLGLFIVLGSIIVFISKNGLKFIDFSIGLAFGVIIMLCITDLIPEVYEIVDNGSILYNVVYIIIGSTIGFLLLKILDYFIPDHDDEHNHNIEDNLKHIGLVASIALVIHNIVEGMAIYLLLTNDFKAGILACCGVGLHNIPLGMVITSAFYKSNKSIKKTLAIILGISLSTFVGGLFVFVFNLTKMLEILESISLSLTIGMLIYISVIELLPKVIYSENKKITTISSILGIMLLVITLLF